MGRRWGKTVLGGGVALSCAAQGAKVAWCVPTYQNGRPLWRWAEQTVAPLQAAKRCRVNRAERVVEFHGGGFVGIYSMDNENSIRGESFHVVVMDEAAMISETAWNEAVQPTLADYDGRAILISTPKGRNWFYDEWQRGQLPNSDVKSWKAPTSANPSPKIRSAFAKAKERLPASAFQQEWLAEFVEDGLTLFRIDDINRAEDGAIGEQPYNPLHEYVTSVDVGRRQDATVINTFDVTQEPYQRVAHDRLERVPYPVIQQAIERRAAAYPGRCFVESNGVGDPVIENLSVSVEPFVTTAKSKTQALQSLQLLLEKGRLKAQWTAQERRELMQYQWDDRNLQQDCVMSLAIGATALDLPEVRVRWLD